MLTTNAVSPNARDGHQDQALRLVSTIGERVDDSSWGSRLDVNGVSAWDALMSPLFVQALKSIREEGMDPRPGLLLGWRGRAHQLLAARGWSRAELRARRQGGRPAPAAIAFWPAELIHTECQLPVARALRGMGQSHLFLTAKPSVLRRLSEAEERPLYTRAAWGPALSSARQRARDSVEWLTKHDPKTIAPRGDVDPALLQAIRATLVRLLPLVFETVAAVDLLLQECGARVLVVGNDLTLEGRTVALRARALGVGVVCLMHGTVTGSPLHARHLADRFLVFGEASQATLRRLGCAESKTVVVGAPQFPAAPHQTLRTHSALTTRLALAKGEPWVLVATSGPGHSVSHEGHRRLVAALMAFSARHPQVKMVAKLHLKDRLSYYEEAARLHPGSRLHVVPPGTADLPPDIFQWLPGCSLVVTGASASAVDAMLMDVPVISVDLLGELEDVDFICARATSHVRSAAALEAVLLEAMERPRSLEAVRERAQAYVHRAFAARGTEAAGRAARIIQDILDETSR